MAFKPGQYLTFQIDLPGLGKGGDLMLTLRVQGWPANALNSTTSPIPDVAGTSGTWTRTAQGGYTAVAPPGQNAAATSEQASPRAPARPVRPMRWM